MANEIRQRYPSGSTLYAHVVRCSDGGVYDGGGFVTPDAADWGDYAIALTEASTTGYYRGDFPAVAAGLYDVFVFLREGGSPATTDPLVGQGVIDWRGASEASLHDLSARLPAALVGGRIDAHAGSAAAGLVDATVAPNLDAAVSGRLAAADYSAPPSAEAVSAQVASDLAAAHGAGSWATATGFSTHTAADVWAAGTRTLTAGTNIQLPANGLANVTAWTVNITGSLSGSVGSVAGTVSANVTQFGGSAGTFSSGRPEVNATHWGGTAVGSASVRANLVQVLGTAPTESASGRLAGAFSTVFDVASPAFTAASVNQTGDSFARIGAAGAGLTAVLTTTLTESYAADGAEFTAAQALYEICQALTDFSISGTTITAKRRDGSATAASYTLDSSSAPTSRTRSG